MYLIDFEPIEDTNFFVITTEEGNRFLCKKVGRIFYDSYLLHDKECVIYLDVFEDLEGKTFYFDLYDKIFPVEDGDEVEPLV